MYNRGLSTTAINPNQDCHPSHIIRNVPYLCYFFLRSGQTLSETPNFPNFQRSDFFSFQALYFTQPIRLERQRLKCPNNIVKILLQNILKTLFHALIFFFKSRGWHTPRPLTGSESSVRRRRVDSLPIVMCDDVSRILTNKRRQP